MRKVLVTGAAGFVGSHLVRQLVRQGCEVVACVRPTSDLWRLEDLKNQIRLVQAELGTFTLDSRSEIFKNIDIVYHLAAASLNPPGEKSLPLVQTNVVGTLSLLNLATELSLKRFVYCGSCFEYPSGNNLSEDILPKPVSEYAASKTSAWLLVNAFHARYALPVVTLRAFTVYGPFEAAYRLIPHVINNALDEKEISLTAGMQTRDFVYIDDMISALLKAGELPQLEGETFNICTGTPTSVESVAKKIVAQIGSGSRLRLGSIPYRDAEIMQLSGNPSKAMKTLDWKPGTLEEGLAQSIGWFRENRGRYKIYA
ncbi:MAG: NAD(P)-dependent oxidoreductase [Deltaproteobacteria bacterium]|nr:NAD(P)-dependent oxidoreductase [Deltaproteobacteria bacterium]